MSKTFLLMAGGTGGHIFPALAVAESLRAQGHEVVWLGSVGSMEERLVPQHNISLELIAMKGVRGKGLLRKLTLPFMLFKCVQAAKEIIRKHNISAVIGFGGFVTFPGGMAAKMLGLPIFVHEQNAVAGMANKRLAKWAARVMYAFPKAFPQYPDGLVGNPVRAEITALPIPEARFAERSGSLKISVVGGSLGAQVLNQIVPQALALLPENQRPQVMHQSGRGNLQALQAAYQAAGVQAECVEFVHDMTAVYRESDLLICRAGALTIAELTVAGVGALLVPFPHAVDDHQTANARYMVSAEAGLLLPQSQLDANKLAQIIGGLTREKCLVWAQNARTLAMPHSADNVAKIVLETVK
ncbi:undecaprenyldiphospho-muramoylpentapeptide beta-N-acetylglucosaminyltransferase [Kingella negevensis]|uniref:UDP-N-acetylglucosamine--N-acetylmuramyl-(pentapeptide) pyrophosphoryl-undecaprenol N-acetylglucosamine transferase n=1 Tax=Kingella negevensis TaxID=1522312 RepID=A0A238TAA5_9NEIS|nr:undecaprenyldiphospho-muramoylpentapeptide beta-N-acetylglucosaminyltransferase [Kingella negevensis]MDK4680850.1 undecaprenyldiphospho-muramoylpentapeptide beta-N-acetylglucosaminyltransferase [Kingella negevensis]MDK4681427.1 undecaprenyldiphospho-muramoylpentapeptide beta-N-acetylglucosaminyltransferase [Kingella negevensis]MDK4684915.1 undecaprenyldiphospho-muramoylpentapeptide beta-N-acetylglucosaminyltransferase [Kingella negevensis]MDK4691813.1 undecaprenyldiphospho-muramoylpentapepti